MTVLVDSLREPNPDPVAFDQPLGMTWDDGMMGWIGADKKIGA